jgi:indolepyruvate ferredoxin oxidoreductase
MAPYTEMAHIFANLGDGTYTHSGILAIRQAIAAKARMTYKILYNDAVAMTGGQPAEGAFSIAAIAAQVAAEGVARIAIVADDRARLPPAGEFPKHATLHAREALDEVQRNLRDYDGVSVLIYDQVCATEKRRRRKRGTMARPARAVVINEAVCENCGDCTVQSDCIAIEPVRTPLGRKRRINPTSCNTDLSCLKGFCPSFVTIADGPAPGADSRWQAREAELAAGLPPPVPPRIGTWRGLFAGIGGGGIVTAGALVAMAAHLEGRHVSTLDFTGLAQKNGAVVSHVRIGEPADADVVRIPLGTADLMLAADLAVAASAGVLERCAAAAAVIGNLDLAATADFKRDPWQNIDAGLHRHAIAKVADANASVYLHAVRLAEQIFGNAQAMNTLLLGIAWQRGLLPVGEAALLRAIELNGTSVALNRRAFVWGRILAENPGLEREILGAAADQPETIEALVDARAAALTAYQNASYATLYRERVTRAAAQESAVLGAPGKLARAAAEGWFRVMGYKDEYEVARLHAIADYGADPVFHLAPPLLSGIDPATGRRRKIAVPGWLARPLFRVLRHGKLLRGTRLDPFGRQAERRDERAMIGEYETDMAEVLSRLTADNLDSAVALALLPDKVRGFGPVKAANLAKARAERAILRARLTEPALSRAAERRQAASG